MATLDSTNRPGRMSRCSSGTLAFISCPLLRTKTTSDGRIHMQPLDAGFPRLPILSRTQLIPRTLLGYLHLSTWFTDNSQQCSLQVPLDTQPRDFLLVNQCQPCVSGSLRTFNSLSTREYLHAGCKRGRKEYPTVVRGYSKSFLKPQRAPEPFRTVGTKFHQKHILPLRLTLRVLHLTPREQHPNLVLIEQPLGHWCSPTLNRAGQFFCESRSGDFCLYQ